MTELISKKKVLETIKTIKRHAKIKWYEPDVDILYSLIKEMNDETPLPRESEYICNHVPEITWH